MEFKFNSIEEVLTFAAQVNRAAVVAPGQVTPAGIDPAGLVDNLARVASGSGKIAAIKIYRAVTGQGLVESKAAVERAPIFASRPVTNVSGYHGCGDPDCGCE